MLEPILSLCVNWHLVRLISSASDRHGSDLQHIFREDLEMMLPERVEYELDAISLPSSSQQRGCALEIPLAALAAKKKTRRRRGTATMILTHPLGITRR